jgi:F-type H+-transporting ATPase subunit a
MKTNSRKIKKQIWQLIIPLGLAFLFTIGHLHSAVDPPQDKLDEIPPTPHEEIGDDFKPADMIFHHIADAYEWHILDYGDFHLSLPLPVILWHNNAFHVFMSGKFHHGHALYKGFGIGHRGYTPYIVKADMQRFDQERIIVQDVNAATPLDFSITKNVLSIFMSVGLMIWIFISVANAYRRRQNQSPKGIQSFLEPVILFVRDSIAIPSIGEKRYMYFMPFLLTLFFFIFLNNLMGLIPIFPGGANVTGNISVTMVLAGFTLMVIVVGANKHYWRHIFNTPGVPWLLKLPIPLMPVIELAGLIIKPVVLMIRLFANITAGHIILLSFISMIFIFGSMNEGFGYAISPVSIAFTIFVNFIELLVAFIQAYVFTLLSALYFGMAVEEAH